MYTLNAAGVPVTRCHWDFFEVTDSSLGKAGIAPAISLDVWNIPTCLLNCPVTKSVEMPLACHWLTVGGTEGEIDR